ncbi:hypothetical protein EVAR_74308_1 [Eumeta japonica]|uniref:Uncharacterized protein n=1 Tax=Eumeta variegata TaxID=151549 RepID=A0A4C1SCZ9_EUMVA|nr:hypothetical protein EVAR_74308_1 [Eumeta japonica]
MYANENCIRQKKNESRINEVEMRLLRSMRGVSERKVNYSSFILTKMYRQEKPAIVKMDTVEEGLCY